MTEVDQPQDLIQTAVALRDIMRRTVSAAEYDEAERKLDSLDLPEDWWDLVPSEATHATYWDELAGPVDVPIALVGDDAAIDALIAQRRAEIEWRTVTDAMRREWADEWVAARAWLQTEGARVEAIEEAAERIRIQDAAKALVRAEKAAAIEMPAAFTLDAFLALDTPEEKYTVDGLWPAFGNVLFSAQRKAGKTVTVHNLVRALCDGDPFMDTFTVGAKRKVALFDFEMGNGLLKEWIAEQEIANTGNLLVIPMRGRASSFDILDDRTRARWADMLRSFGAEVIILDPLRPILHGLGLNEWNETGPFLQAFDALKADAGIADGFLVQHHGHHAERAAGDSNLVGWADAIWNLTRDDVDDPRSFRFFDAYGRDVDQDKGLVSLYDGKRLAFAADARKGKDDRLMSVIADYVKSNPGAKADDISKAGIRGVSKNTVRDLLNKALAADLIRVETGDKNAKLYYSLG